MPDIDVLVCDEEGHAALEQLPGVRPVHYDADAPLPPEAATAEILIPPFLSPASGLTLAEQMPKLRLVQLLTAGAEIWVGNLAEGVALSDCKGAHGGATAEWIVGALLAIYRDLPVFQRAQDEGRWDYHRTDELDGKSVLIVGAGDVATQTVSRLTPFGVSTTLVGRTARDGVHGIDEVHDLLPCFDACVVIVPLTDDTRGLIDARFLAAMPDGAILVNAARGPVADTDALVAELTSGRIRAAVDVTDPEPLPEGHPLWSAPGLLLTPHVGGSVPGAMRRAYGIAVEQIAAFVRGERPPNLVENGY